MPISCLDSLSTDTLHPLAEVAAAAAGDSAAVDAPAIYANGAPNYTYVTQQPCVSSYFSDGARTEEGYVEGAERYAYAYSVVDAANYMQHLLEAGFTVSGSEAVEADTVIYYTRETETGPIHVGVCVSSTMRYIYIYLPDSLPDSGDMGLS